MAFVIDLKGKVALVTGGAKGIGYEICRQLAAAGADVVINDNSIPADTILDKEMKCFDVRVLMYKADVTCEKEVIAMINNAVNEFGRIDILVNNAGILMPSKIEEMSYDTWKRVIDVNLNGAFLVTRYTVPHMFRQNYGSIIMISSGTVINGGGGGVNYPASKAGMEGIVKQLTRECAPRGVRVNVIQPAVIDTDLFRQRYPADTDVEKYGQSIPVGRVGKPLDIANAVVFLASDKASYITGTTLLIDGGRTFYKN